MSIPISTFSGTLRQISPESLNSVGQSVLYLCAPKFLPAPEHNLVERLQAAREHMSKYVTHVYASARPFRRWSGDFFSDLDDKHRLERGNYFSVCQRNDGYDAGTLEAELNAYRSTDEDFYVHFIDALIEGNAEQLQLSPSAHIIALIVHPDKALQRLTADFADELRTLLTQAADKGSPLIITLGTVITSARIEGILDLRQRVAQDWFFDTYVSRRLIPTAASSFVDILPELLQPHLGGSTGSNLRLQAIGADLRRAGLNGLIYPSARTDVGVGYAGDEIVRFRGWNMVLYRGQPPREFMHGDPGGWETEFWAGIKVHKEVDSSGRLSQWYVMGLDAVNIARYDSQMELRGVVP